MRGARRIGERRWTMFPGEGATLTTRLAGHRLDRPPLPERRDWGASKNAIGEGSAGPQAVNAAA